MTFCTRLPLLLACGAFMAQAQSQTLMLSACSRLGNEQWCLDQNGSSVLWTSYASSTAASTAPATAAVSTTAAPTTTHSSSSITAVSGCHMHGSVWNCMAGTSEFHVMQSATATEELSAQYTGCHSHGSTMYCLDAAGKEYELVAEGAEASGTEESHDHDHDHDHESESTESSSSGKNCHFHAGVEHCVGEGESESGGTRSCERTDREYNVPLRIGLLFVIFATSAIAVFAPILMGSYLQNNAVNFCLMILKQFGTGVMLLTHATLMLTNECIKWPAEYEGTPAAIMMAGIFLAFLTEYLGARFLHWRNHRNPSPAGLESGNGSGSGASDGKAASASPPNALTTIAGCGNALGGAAAGHPGQEKLAVAVMEAGIIFHSLLIGLTLVVAADSFFPTLFAVILFHQCFEGIALGSRIAELPSTSTTTTSTTSSTTKYTMATLFALTTPLGMAIGIGCLGRFNGNDPATLVAIGTLDAVSAGILAWVGLVEMWAGDWMHGGVMAGEGAGKTVVGLGALGAGMVGMGVLGKWA
ncbi:zinc iron transporter protein [Diplodia corticola]|uniref:Zinc iron transporter protein n=1 Tax=Diplodia corticola TaxID=236234 RepID=A0A1J9RYZ9_9PEZI|nr:zinc iron transporter protein [Diplodia corticola]OJD37899.1 zinc iron transporter protein [Diplodia corticola]